MQKAGIKFEYNEDGLAVALRNSDGSPIYENGFGPLAQADNGADPFGDAASWAAAAADGALRPGISPTSASTEDGALSATAPKAAKPAPVGSFEVDTRGDEIFATSGAGAQSRTTRIMLRGLEAQNVKFTIDENDRVFVYQKWHSLGYDQGYWEAVPVWDTDASMPVYQDYAKYDEARAILTKFDEANYVISMVEQSNIPVIITPETALQVHTSNPRFIIPGANQATGLPRISAIYWNPNVGIMTTGRTGTIDYNSGKVVANPKNRVNKYTTDGAVMSPAMVLLHEFGHAFEYLYHSNRLLTNGLIKRNDGFTANEEARVIEGLELRASKFFKQPTRTNHGGTPIWVPSVGFFSW
jgi:hypothetical protein